MRKLLLATTAVVGASMGMTGFAAAQTLGPEALGGTVVTTLSGGHASTYGNNNYSSGNAVPGPVAVPTPGTMVVHFGILVLSEAEASWSTGAGGDHSVPGTKVSPLNLNTYVRFYPGVDAMAANGLRYGAAVEMRQNFYGNNTTTTGLGGLTSQTGSSGGTTQTTNQTIFVRREFVYVAADNFGVVRVGETDGVIGTFDEGGATTGVFLSPTGTIVGGDLQGDTTGAWMAPYFGAQSANEYGTEKIFYDSPSFAGFDIAAQYSPHPFNGFGMANGCLATVSCTNYSSTLENGSVQTNTYAVGLRYQGKIGPAAVLAYGVYMGSGNVNATGVGALQYDNLSLGMFGANVTFAGLSVFGNVMHGSMNGILGVKPKGAPDATGLGAGVKYAIDKFTIGGVYSQYDDQGSVADVGLGQSHAWVIDLAATYKAAPGLTFYGEYAYGQTHQGGPVPAANGSTQALLVGTAVTW